MTILWIGLGGFIGANARYFMGRAIVERWGMAFPWGTLAVNVLGSLAIGIILEVLAQRTISDPAYRLFLVVGFLGGFTTFSTFAFEAVTFIQEERWLRAGVYVLASNLLSIAVCLLGIWMVRRLA